MAIDYNYPRRRTLRAFFSLVSVDPASGCWNWSGKLKRGYGRFAMCYAHRWSYWKFGAMCIPYGYHVDHLCFNPRCVNPTHLEAVTPAENSRRAWARRRLLRVVA